MRLRLVVCACFVSLLVARDLAAEDRVTVRGNYYRETSTRVLAPALMAGAFGDGPLGSAIARPLIAAHLVSVARMENASAVAHGATGADRDRLEVLIRDLAPELAIHALDVVATEGVAVDENLWARSVRRPADSGPDAGTSVRTFTRTHAPEACSPDPAVVEIAFDRIMRSGRHRSGFAMRFPRIVRIRDDKTPAEIDTMATVEALFGDQASGRILLATGARGETERIAAVGSGDE